MEYSDRTIELLQADKEGRIAILPVPLGSVVYTVVYEPYPMFPKHMFYHIEALRMSERFAYKKLGEDYFATFEEAESFCNRKREDDAKC